MRPDLTLSLGVRYEYNAPPVDAQNRANVFDVATQSLVPVGTNGVPRSGYEPDRNNWAPRVGVAWSPGNRTRVFRAGYGIDYDQGALATGEGLYFNPPYLNFQVYFPLPGLPLLLNNPFPQSFPPYPSSALGFQRNFRTPYVQQWNFGIQQQIGKNRVVEIDYVGSKGTKLLAARDINQALPSPQMPNPRPNPQFADIDYLESRANSSYNSLQARFQQRLTTSLSSAAKSHAGAWAIPRCSRTPIRICSISLVRKTPVGITRFASCPEPKIHGCTEPRSTKTTDRKRLRSSGDSGAPCGYAGSPDPSYLGMEWCTCSPRRRLTHSPSLC